MKFLFVCFQFFSAVSLASPYIEVQAHSQISAGEVVTLGDLAIFQGLDDANAKKLKSIVIEDEIDEGEKEIFSSRVLAQLIRKKGGAYLAEAKLKIPQRVTLEGISYELTEDVLKAELRKQWKPFCTDCRFVIQSISLPRIPEDLKGQKWVLETKPSLPKGSFSQKIEVKLEDRKNPIFWVTGQMQVLKKVPVVTRSLMRGARLTAEDIKEEYRDITHATDASPKLEATVGKKLSKSLRAKDIIWFSSLERIKALNRGEPIRIIVGEDNWELSLQGVALQDGSVGDRVKVKNPITRKTLTAIVVGESEVRIK